MLKCTSIFFLVSIFVIHAVGQELETINPRMSQQDQRAAGERNRAIINAKKAKEKEEEANRKMQEENQKKQEEYNKLADELNAKNKQINEVFYQIKNCETSKYKSLQAQLDSCGRKSVEQYTSERKLFLNSAVKSQESIKSKYDKFLSDNIDSKNGKFYTKDVLDTTEAMKYYANPNSDNQSVGVSNSSPNSKTTLEQRVVTLENDIKKLKEFIKKNIGEDKNSICRKVSSCPQISNLKEKVDAIKTMADPYGTSNSSGPGSPPPIAVQK